MKSHKTKKFECKTCSDKVKENDLREHAEEHTPQATGMNYEDILTNYNEIEYEKLTKKQIAKYLKSGANECPHCDSDDITAGETHFSGKEASVEVRCLACKSEWYDQFMMVSITEK